MFDTVTDTEPARDVDLGPVPLSHLVLDLAERPAAEWGPFFAARGVEVVLDDLGRPAVSRTDAHRLFAEAREMEALAREVAARREAEAIEQDRQRRASIWTGVSADDLPVGAAPAAAMLAAARDAEPKRTTPLQEALSGESMTFHSYQSTPEDESA
jgi:hypothetical protein